VERTLVKSLYNFRRRFESYTDLDAWEKRVFEMPEEVAHEVHVKDELTATVETLPSDCSTSSAITDQGVVEEEAHPSNDDPAERDTQQLDDSPVNQEYYRGDFARDGLPSEDGSEVDEGLGLSEGEVYTQTRGMERFINKFSISISSFIIFHMHAPSFKINFFISFFASNYQIVEVGYELVHRWHQKKMYSDFLKQLFSF